MSQDTQKMAYDKGMGQTSPSRGPLRVRKRRYHDTLMLVSALSLLVVLSIAGVVAWWLARDKAPVPIVKKQFVQQSEKAVQSDPRCEQTKSATYFSKDYGFGFCYPKAWGEVQFNNALFSPDDTGRRIRLSFSHKNMISVGVVSKNWTTKVPRDIICTDASVPTVPSFTPFSRVWQPNNTTPVTYAIRGVEMAPGKYLIQEYTDSLKVHGACLEGYVLIGGAYGHVTLTYGAEYDQVVKNPVQHMANPYELIDTSERAQYVALVKSVFAY